MWQDIGYHSRFCLVRSGLISEATCFALDTSDCWLLAVLNSPLIYSCGVCLEFYGVTDKLKVGKIGNAFGTIEMLFGGEGTISL